MADRAASERYMNMAPLMVHRGMGWKYRAGRRPIQRGRQNQCGPSRRGRPKGRIQERLAGFPDLTPTIEDMFSAHDKIVTRLVWHGTHTGSYGGVKWGPSRLGQAGGGPGLCRLAFRGRRGSGNLNDTGSVRACKANRIFPRRSMRRSPVLADAAAERGRWSAPCGEERRPGADFVRLVAISTQRVG